MYEAGTAINPSERVLCTAGVSDGLPNKHDVICKFRDVIPQFRYETLALRHATPNARSTIPIPGRAFRLKTWAGTDAVTPLEQKTKVHGGI